MTKVIFDYVNRVFSFCNEGSFFTKTKRLCNREGCPKNDAIAIEVVIHFYAFYVCVQDISEIKTAEVWLGQFLVRQ